MQSHNVATTTRTGRFYCNGDEGSTSSSLSLSSFQPVCMSTLHVADVILIKNNTGAPCTINSPKVVTFDYAWRRCERPNDISNIRTQQVQNQAESVAILR